MYFKHRHQAGELLAAKLAAYRYENTAVLALSEGGVVVGEQIARQLHSTLSLLLTAPITLPGLGDEAIGVIDAEGHFTDNKAAFGILEYAQEMRTAFEEEKLRKMYDLASVLSEYGEVNPDIFYGRHVIIVSDGLKSGIAFEAAVNYLKPIKTGKLVAAVPVVSVTAVDRLHALADEMQVLSVIENYLDTNHYYEENPVINAKSIMDSINKVITNWH